MPQNTLHNVLLCGRSATPSRDEFVKKLRISLLFVLEVQDTLYESEWGRILYARKSSPDVIRGHPSRRSSVSGFRRVGSA